MTPPAALFVPFTLLSLAAAIEGIALLARHEARRETGQYEPPGRPWVALWLIAVGLAAPVFALAFYR